MKDKSRVKLIIRTCISLIVLLGVLSKAHSVLEWKDTTGDYISSYKELYSLPENTVDVAFVGSSHVYCGIYPCLLWEQCGIAAFDMSVSGMDKDSSIHALIELYKTQHPKLVVLDLYGLFINGQAIDSNKYRNLLGMRLSFNSLSLVMGYDYIDESERLDYIFRWPIIHTRYTELKKYDFIGYQRSIYGKGARFDWTISEADIKDESSFMSDEIGSLDEVNSKWLDEFVKIAHDNGSEVMFIMIPTTLNENQQMCINAVKMYASDNNIQFRDFNRLRDDIDIIEDEDFYDYDHLNAFGAEKVTNYIGDLVSKTYDLSNHELDSNYDSWNLDLKDYYHSKLLAEIETLDDSDKIKVLSKEEGYITVISAEGINNWEDYSDVFESAGISEEKALVGGKWILIDGTIAGEISNQSKEEYYLDLGDMDYLKVSAKEMFSEDNIMINNKGFSNTQNGIAVIVYDTFWNKVVLYHKR